MNILIILFDLLFAIPLFFLLNYFTSSNKDTMKLNITYLFLPQVYLVVLAGILASLNLSFLLEHIFLIVVFECFYRLIYINHILNYDSLINHKYYYLMYAMIILFAYLLDINFISKVDNVFPEPMEFRNQIWFLIIIFLYIILRDKVKCDFLREQSIVMSKKQEYIVMTYAKLKNQFRKVVVSKEDKDLIPLVYSIMIYENFLTPPVFRTVKSYLYRFTNKEMKFGIMQILSKVYLSDEESIKISLKKLEAIYKKEIKNSKKKIIAEKKIAKILSCYQENQEYQNNVLEIYRTIINFEQ